MALPLGLFIFGVVAVLSVRMIRLTQSGWWEEHISGTANCSPECFDCNEGSEMCYTDPLKCEDMRKTNLKRFQQ